MDLSSPDSSDHSPLNDPSSGQAWRRAAAAVAGAQQYPASTLYVVATPIGNLADLSLRAVHVLSMVEAVACEDTRVTATLLNRLGVSASLVPVHEHNEQTAAERVVDRLRQGERVAYVSDAGTPGVSDPGARLVAIVRAAGFGVMPLPGPSAVATALSAAGDAGGDAGPAFVFQGFLPAKGRARQAAVEAMVRLCATTVVFEAPHRIVELARELAQHCPQRRVTVCRELTKQFEQIHTAESLDLPAFFAGGTQRVRGEFVLVLHAQATADPDEPADDTRRWLHALLEALPVKQAVATYAKVSGEPRNAVYEAALAWKAAQLQNEDTAADDGSSAG